MENVVLNGNFQISDITFGGGSVVYESSDPALVAKWILDNNRYPVLTLWMDDGFEIQVNGGSACLRHPGMINLLVERFYPQALMVRDEKAIELAKESGLTSKLSVEQLRESIDSDAGECRDDFEKLFEATNA